jgi:hypothetical protein
MGSLVDKPAPSKAAQAHVESLWEVDSESSTLAVSLAEEGA